MIHVKFSESSWRGQNFDKIRNNHKLKAKLDIVHEISEEAQNIEETAKIRAT